MTVKAKAKRVKFRARANPVTSAGSIGIFVSIVGRYLGWSEQIQADVATLFLLSLPVVNFVTSRWFPSLGASAVEYVEDVEDDAVDEAEDV